MNAGREVCGLRPDSEITKGLQTFALREIEALQAPDGQIFLKCQMENGLTFGRRIELEKLETLHRRLGEFLGAKSPQNDGES